MVTLAARLDRRTGRRILCGRIDCGHQIAEVREDLQEGTSDSVPALLRVRQVWFLPGWAWYRQEGEWRVSKYAQGRVVRGQRPKVRRYPRVAGASLHRHDALWSPAELPTEAICWQCGSRNKIDWEGLGFNICELSRLDQEYSTFALFVSGYAASRVSILWTL